MYSFKCMKCINTFSGLRKKGLFVIMSILLIDKRLSHIVNVVYISAECNADAKTTVTGEKRL